MKPSVHFLDLGTSPSDDAFSLLWQLDVSNPPKQKDNSLGEWKSIAEGDLLVFPGLLSGAGEFESLRIAGSQNGSLLQALPIGIEYPEFPSAIVEWSKSKDLSLRRLYEVPFDAFLQSEPPKSKLVDVFGGETEVNEFWTNPPIQRGRRVHGDPWIIHLADCTWIKTIDGMYVHKK